MDSEGVGMSGASCSDISLSSREGYSVSSEEISVKKKEENEDKARINILEKRLRILVVVVIIMSVLLFISTLFVVSLLTLIVKNQMDMQVKHQMDESLRFSEAFEIVMIDSREDVISYLMVEDAFLIDVRTRAEFHEGSIKGAINVPYDEIYDCHPEIPHDDENLFIVVFCRTGRRSAMAKKILEKIGFLNVVNGGGLRTMRMHMEDAEKRALERGDEPEEENKNVVKLTDIDRVLME